MRLRVIASVTVALFSLCTFPSAHAAPIYVFPVADCPVKYARSHHDYPATDILAKAGCKYVAPIDGVVYEVARKIYGVARQISDKIAGIISFNNWN